MPANDSEASQVADAVTFGPGAGCCRPPNTQAPPCLAVGRGGACCSRAPRRRGRANLARARCTGGADSGHSPGRHSSDCGIAAAEASWGPPCGSDPRSARDCGPGRGGGEAVAAAGCLPRRSRSDVGTHSTARLDCSCEALLPSAAPSPLRRPARPRRPCLFATVPGWHRFSSPGSGAHPSGPVPPKRAGSVATFLQSSEATSPSLFPRERCRSCGMPRAPRVPLNLPLASWLRAGPDLDHPHRGGVHHDHLRHLHLPPVRARAPFFRCSRGESRVSGFLVRARAHTHTQLLAPIPPPPRVLRSLPLARFARRSAARRTGCRASASSSRWWLCPR